MRIYGDCYQLMSEIFRDVSEMGVLVHPQTMQNKDIRNDDDYLTKEVMNYSFCLTSLEKEKYLFLAEPETMADYAQQELHDRFSSHLLNPGFSQFKRFDVWKKFLNKRGRHDYTYNERLRTQIGYIIEELRENPDTRQAILSVWNPTIDINNLGGIKRVPCSIYYQFLLREGKLNIIYNMRSCDVVTHFGIDIWLSFRTMAMIARSLELAEGNLFVNIGSLHAYKKDWLTLKQCIEDARK